MTSSNLLLWGATAHLVTDWCFQNDWQAANKGIAWTPGTPLRSAVLPFRHPASYVHAALHALALCLVFPWYAALAVGFIHWLVDLRIGLVWWRHFFGQDQGPVAVHVAIWEDQAVHVAVIAAAALVVGRGF